MRSYSAVRVSIISIYRRLKIETVCRPCPRIFTEICCRAHSRPHDTDGHIHRTYRRVREGNFALDGLPGKTVGIIGTGKISLMTARILKGFGCHLLGYDATQTPSFREIGHYAELDTLLSQADIALFPCTVR